MTLRVRDAEGKDQLVDLLAAELAIYRESRNDRRPGPFAVHEVLQQFEPDQDASLLEGLDLKHTGQWHLQIHGEGGPIYYARARFLAQASTRWIVDWIGEDWLARPFERAIKQVDSDLDAEYQGFVDAVVSRRFRFSTLWLRDPDLHVMVRPWRRMEAHLQPGAIVSSKELLERLRAFYGDRRL